MEVDRHQVVEAAQRLVDQQRYAQALIQYKKLVESDPTDARTLLKVGELHLKLGEHADAVDAFAQVGDVYASLEEPHKALAAYARVRELVVHQHPHTPAAEATLRRTSMASVDLYERLGLSGDAVAVVSELAAYYEKGARWAEAEPLRRRALFMAPDDVAARVKLARALLHEGQGAEAVPLVRTAARRLVDEDRAEDALAVLEHLLQRAPDATCARMAAELYLARDTQQDAVRALAKLQSCVRADPEDVDALRLVAVALRRVGHHERAVQVDAEIDAIADADGRPTPVYPVEELGMNLAVEHASNGSGGARAPSEPDLVPPSAPGTDAPIRVIPVDEASWAAIAARLGSVPVGQRDGEGKEEIVAFVREGESARDTMRVIYGVVKFFLA
jgi:tetratricopeptide (TPR) repeat protein